MLKGMMLFLLATSGVLNALSLGMGPKVGVGFGGQRLLQYYDEYYGNYASDARDAISLYGNVKTAKTGADVWQGEITAEEGAAEVAADTAAEGLAGELAESLLLLA
eukprot:CAMPEP_0202690778 /NCGR_PEP_ID=MMETSP1385-20130828/5673_1 /ASSEMBLY_ACC=CAM_ASM_000861 /TAXON_ID=933848 /ORGANISM="Elphidium margaritaceum" /LENGTH=105 /DNA_ID=CAMNT_0049346075 /DNA_START=74 /DNA_END=391 /DNA_ORIENTATION=+